MSKFTPEPWKSTKTHNFADTYVEYIDKQQDDRDQAIAQTRALTREVSEANAKLIAAAPELLEALKALSFQFAVAVDTPYSKDKEVYEQAQQAIAKAE